MAFALSYNGWWWNSRRLFPGAPNDRYRLLQRYCMVKHWVFAEDPHRGDAEERRCPALRRSTVLSRI